MEELNYFSVSALINAFTSLSLGTYILVTSYKKRIARYLAYFCFAVAAWSIPYFFWQIATTSESALFWSRGLMYGAVFTSISFFHMVLVFLNLERKLFYKASLVIFYLISFFWVAVNSTSLFVLGVEPRLSFEFWPIPGPLYGIFLFFFVVHVLFASVLLFQKYRNSTGVIKNQTLFLLIGIFLAFVGGSTNYFLWYNVPILPWGNGLVSVYVVLTVYSIMKYGFLNFRVIATEIFVGLFLIIFFFDVILAKSLTELLFRVFGLTIAWVFGAILIKSVRKEVERGDEIAKLAKSLEKANLRLQELDRQKTEFLSIASHQLRTPLSIIKGYAELMKDGVYGKPTKKMVGVLNDMDESNERLVHLVDEFLNITRLEQGRISYSFEPHDVNVTVTSVVEELQNRAKEKGLNIVWSKPKKECTVIMDEEKVRHVIFNFVDNAIKYSPKGSVRVTVSEEGDTMTVRVNDQGFGFDKEDEANFFQKFYRGRNVEHTDVSGTGLGIYVCKKFIEMHDGRVWAKSPGLGKGSEFGFSIPVKGPKNTKVAQG